jgi:hypothetical protein
MSHVYVALDSLSQLWLLQYLISRNGMWSRHGFSSAMTTTEEAYLETSVFTRFFCVQMGGFWSGFLAPGVLVRYTPFLGH